MKINKKRTWIYRFIDKRKSTRTHSHTKIYEILQFHFTSFLILRMLHYSSLSVSLSITNMGRCDYFILLNLYMLTPHFATYI